MYTLEIEHFLNIMLRNKFILGMSTFIFQGVSSDRWKVKK